MFLPGIKISNSIPKKYNELWLDELEEIRNRVILNLSSILTNNQSAAFYHEIAKIYHKCELKINRFPTIIDLILYLSDYVFTDPRGAMLFERYSNRTRGDISELAFRIANINKECTTACPDCLILGNCQYEPTLGNRLLDKMLLQQTLKGILEGD